MADKYANFVEHPRYGQRPRITGLNPSPFVAGVHLHWNATSTAEVAQQHERVTGKKWPYGHARSERDSQRIANTAVRADLKRQTPATVAVTHYFDLERKCIDCRRPFIFFADEQKYWYEELGFGLESDCVRCVECRKQQQGVAQLRQRYEELCHVSPRSIAENVELAECCLTLIEQAVFTPRQLPRVRMFLNTIPDDAEQPLRRQHDDLLARVRAVESRPLP
jgi:hypothetical protein